MVKLLLLKILSGHAFVSRGWAFVKCHPCKNRQKVLFWEWHPSSEDVAICNSVKPYYLVEGMGQGKILRTARGRAMDLGL